MRGDIWMADPRRPKLRAARHNKQDTRAVDPSYRQFKQLKSRWVQPMSILKYANRRMPQRKLQEHIDKCVNRSVFDLLRCQPCKIAIVLHRNRQQVSDEEKLFPGASGCSRQISLKLCDLVRVGFASAQIRRLFDLLDDGKESALAVIRRRLMK